MTDQDHFIAHGPGACEAVSRTMIGHFVTRLELEAHRSGGTLTADQIRQFADAFLHQEMSLFGPVYRRSWDNCSVVRQEMQWENGPHRPFDRILMHPFTHLFLPAAHDKVGVLSRRMIPGFHMAVDKMIGPALYEKCQRIAKIIMDRHTLANGGPNWQAIYVDPDSVALTHDVLVVFVHYFENFDRRCDWFLTLVNSHLSPADPQAPDAHWMLTKSGFLDLMICLFADLRKTLLVKRDFIADRYGAHTVQAMEQFFITLGMTTKPCRQR